MATKKTTKPGAKHHAKKGGSTPGKRQKREVKLKAPHAKSEHLTPGEEAFTALLAKGESQRHAFLEAFPQAKKWAQGTVDVKASILTGTDKVQIRLTELLAAAAKANEADVALVLKEYLTRLKADPRELTEIRVSACRYCHGIGNRYQSTDGELEEARTRWEQKQADGAEKGLQIPDFNERGGGGYDRALKPLASCPACGGDGEPRVVLKDTANLSPGALALFGGVKETKEGIDVRIADRDSALEKIARHVGFFERDNATEVTVTIDAAELDAIYERAMAKSKQDAENAKGRMDRIKSAPKADDNDE